MKKTCDGNCKPHHGPLHEVHIRDPRFGKDWGHFTYCEAAIQADRRTGLLVTIQQPSKEEDVPAEQPSNRATIDIVFDGPPGPEAGRFVEVEDACGRSFRTGEWVERPDGYWVLRLSDHRIIDQLQSQIVTLQQELVLVKEQKYAALEAIDKIAEIADCRAWGSPDSVVVAVETMEKAHDALLARIEILERERDEANSCCTATSQCPTCCVDKKAMAEWYIYYKNREYARQTGDPLLGVVEATTKEEAELKARQQGLGGCVSVWATQAHLLPGERIVFQEGDSKMSCHTKETLENMLEDVVNALDLADLAIEQHGPLGTPPAELVRLVLEQKDQEIRLLRQGFMDAKQKMVKECEDSVTFQKDLKTWRDAAYYWYARYHGISDSQVTAMGPEDVQVSKSEGDPE